ncbi:hypothetical protein [Dictyobacter aurantiacus]|uniref:Uncharacterized protein n=1 Tax=Dictyobacter aurantiacus TaxID=1936993 RepID=A0A401ZIG9_9CHLR|nr:hypothetical protein [Dictyobacter aurantiacus]GCE06637.1 hypothetical protein KDAU_39660 [Dictyobacter aurantiacus]
MPLVSPDNSATSSDEIMRYPFDTMRTVAATILSNVSIALSEHEIAWKKAQDYVQSLPDPLQPAFMDVLNKHQQRIRDSYKWQEDFAGALFNAIDTVSNTDSNISTSFQKIDNAKFTGFGHGHLIVADE